MKNKKLLGKLKTFASYISDYIDSFEHRDDLVFKLDKLKNTRNITYPSHNIKIDSNQSCISFVNSLDENNFKLFKNFFIDKINKKNLEQECYDKLNELVKDFDIYIIDFAVYSKNHFGIKVQILDQVYLFDFNGTLDKLSESLIDEHNELIECDILCPYCDVEIKSLESLCKCGVNIIHEFGKTNDISYLVEECGGIEVIRNNGYKSWFLDDESMRKFESITNDPENYFNIKFEEYIKNEKYEHINSDSIIDTKYELNGIEFTITRNDYFKYITEICLKYCNWIKSGDLYDVNHDDDYYDHSGNLELISSGNKYRNITSFETVYDWIFGCYNGNKRATYCSGAGFSHDTYYDSISENINFESIVFEKINITPDDEIYDDLISGDESFEIGNEIEAVVYDYLKEMKAIQCWNDYSEYEL